MMKSMVLVLFGLIAISMADPIGNFGLNLGGFGLGDGAANGGGVTGGFAVGRGVSFGPGGVKTTGFGPIGGIFPFFGR